MSIGLKLNVIFEMRHTEGRDEDLGKKIKGRFGNPKM